jgi:transposase
MEVERPLSAAISGARANPIPSTRRQRPGRCSQARLSENLRAQDGKVEMIRVLRSARQSAVKARSQATNQLQALLVTASEDLRHRLRQLPTKELVATCARFRLGSEPDEVRTATKFALRSVARRYQALSREIAEL